MPFHSTCVLYSAGLYFFQDSWTALLNAAKQGFADSVLLLLEAGANIEHRDTVSIVSESDNNYCLFCKMSVVTFNSTKRRAQSFIVSYIGYTFITACS